MTVLICDGQRMAAESIALALGGFDIEVVSVTHTAAEAGQVALRSSPDVYLVDRKLPDADGFDLVRRIRAVHPHARVLVVTDDDSPSVKVGAREAGAAGLASRQLGLAGLAQAVRRVHEGGRMDGSMPGVRSHRQANLVRLVTDRELAVLRAMVEGNGTVAIAAELGISYHTVRTHVSRLMEKLGAGSKLELVALAVQHRLVRPPSAASAGGLR